MQAAERLQYYIRLGSIDEGKIISDSTRFNTTLNNWATWKTYDGTSVSNTKDSVK